LHASLQKDGDAWIGITVRAPAATALKKLDPARYATLNLPVNDIEWDILRQVGGLTKQSGPRSPLEGLKVRRLYMAGYSQSGIDVATFAMAFTPLTRMSDGTSVYDGYLPESHSGSLTPLKSGTTVLVRFESRPMVPVTVPVLDTETQTDIEGFRAAINPTLSYTSPGSALVRRSDADTPADRYRLWEIPGAPHAPKIPGCVGSSDFPVDAFARAAYAALTRWAEQGIAPPTAARIETAKIGVVSVSQLDTTGNALGGVRSPFVDVPLARYQAHSMPGAICELAGRKTFLPAAMLARRYGTQDDYMTKFDTDLGKTIAAGFLLNSDRASLIAQQQNDARQAFG
jgi:hypothetical protein